jgi:hypothetical protein
VDVKVVNPVLVVSQGAATMPSVKLPGAFATPFIDCFPEPELIELPWQRRTPEVRCVCGAVSSEPSPLIDMKPPFEVMLVPFDVAELLWQGPKVTPAASLVVPKPLAAPPGMFSLLALTAPPPKVIAPPVDPQEPEDHPEQMVLVAANLIPPPFDASVSDQRVIGPAFVRKLMLAAVRTLRLDFNTKALFAPVTVMFAPAVKSLDEPVAVSATGPEALMAPVGDTTPPVMLTPPPLAVKVPAPEYVSETETEIEVPAVTFLANVAEPPEEDTCTDPDVEEIVALEAEVVVMFPDPDNEMPLDASKIPVGAMVDPPATEMVPAEFMVADDANVVVGEKLMFPELVVVIAKSTDCAPPL